MCSQVPKVAVGRNTLLERFTYCYESLSTKGVTILRYPRASTESREGA